MYLCGKNSNKDKFINKYEKYKRIVYFYICSYIDKEELANQILIEVFFEFYSESKQSFNNLLNISKKIISHHNLNLELLDPKLLKSDSDFVNEVSKNLNKVEFYVFSYRVVFELSYHMVARILKISYSMVILNMRNASKKIKKMNKKLEN